jgi:hypothetical protein
MTAPFFHLRVTMEGDVLVDRLVKGVEARMANVMPAWPAVVRQFREIMTFAFFTEGGTTGRKWPDLAPSTQADRVRKGFPGAHPILQRTGKLARALVSGGEGGFLQATPRRLAIGVDESLDYFKYHQSNRPRSRLPRRAPVLLTADDRTALMHPIRLWVTGRDPNAQRRASAP